VEPELSSQKNGIVLSTSTVAMTSTVGFRPTRSDG